MEWNIRLTSSANLSSRLCRAYENIVTSRMILTSKSQSSCSVIWMSISRRAVAWPQIRWPPGVGGCRFWSKTVHCKVSNTVLTLADSLYLSFTKVYFLISRAEIVSGWTCFMRPLPSSTTPASLCILITWDIVSILAASTISCSSLRYILLGISLRVCEAMSLDWSKPMRYVTTSVFSRDNLGHLLVI